MPSSTSWIWNGTDFVPCSGVPAWDRGFRYGMAFFESLALRGGRVEFLQPHLARLEEACRRCVWPVDPAALRRAGEWLQQAPGPAFARVYVTAGEGEPMGPVNVPRVFLLIEPMALPSGDNLRQVRMHPEPFLPLLGGLKTANYWANLAALQMARAAERDEALLFNPRGELISACTANVFLELDGQWVTPPVSTGARSGVVREWVMGRREVLERVVFRDELQRATGGVLTSSWAGVAPVASLDGAPLETGPGVTLRAEFLESPL